jgi:hypothetical protein
MDSTFSFILFIPAVSALLRSSCSSIIKISVSLAWCGRYSFKRW